MRLLIRKLLKMCEHSHYNTVDEVHLSLSTFWWYHHKDWIQLVHNLQSNPRFWGYSSHRDPSMVWACPSGITWQQEWCWLLGVLQILCGSTLRLPGWCSCPNQLEEACEINIIISICFHMYTCLYHRLLSSVLWDWKPTLTLETI